MATVFSKKIIVSIDVGTTKISVLVAQMLDSGNFEIIGIGKAPSDGLKKGVVADVAKTVYSIKNAVKEAEIMAGISIESASIGISGAHINSLNSHGVVPLKHGNVKPFDITNVLAAARAIPVPDGQQILHVLPQYFVIDGHDRVQDPLGMHGIRLEVQAHIILGGIASVQNLIKCCELAGIKVTDIILEQLASGDAVLSDDERQLGVAVLDIGGGTSDLALYQQGNIRHTMVLPLAGQHFTNDLAVGVRTTLKEAERIKKQFGNVYCITPSEGDLIEIEAVQGTDKQLISITDMNRILQARAAEILMLVQQEIVARELQQFMRTGLVLTGGGSLLKGMKELGEHIFKVPVRIGAPRVAYQLPELLDSPIFATGYGLLINTLRREQEGGIHSLDGPLVKRIFIRMKSWVSDFF
ncbi:MAG: cell division protein FtsA [Candidatus Dependentiae bacterium]|nr:cell division protein FtsA [Candidatus Dependentiae bacterium]